MKPATLLAAVIAAVLLASASGQAQTPVTIKASTVLDGKGGTLHNVAIVVQGSKIVRIETTDHPTDGEIVALARRYFKASDRMG